MSSQHNTSSHKKSQQNTLYLLQFNKITNIELYNTLETIERPCNLDSRAVSIAKDIGINFEIDPPD